MRKFTLTIDGCAPIHGVLTEDAVELDALLAGLPDREPPATDVPSALPGPAPTQPRPRGRPSFAAVLAKAVAQLNFDSSRPIADRARDVLKHLAETGAEIPARRTVENYLAEHGAARKKERRKSRNKSRKKSVALSSNHT